MKNNIIQDERIVSAKTKIQSDAFQIFTTLLILSVLVQQFILNAPFSQFAVEFFCWIACALYVCIQNFRMGTTHSHFEAKTTGVLLKQSIYTGIPFIVLFAILTGSRDTTQLLVIFLSFTTINFLFQFVMNSLNQKKEKKILAELNADEMSINDCK